MKYYSEVTKKVYDTVEDLEKAEKVLTDKAAARKKDAAEVEKAFEAAIAAQKNYEKLLTEFCSKHGAYHKTIKADDVDKNWESLSALLDLLKL